MISTGLAHAGRKKILDHRSGLWDEAALFREMRTLVRLYPNHAGFLVEDNGMQKILVGITQRPEIMRSYGWRDEDLERLRVLGWTTGKNKHDQQLGIRALSIDVKAGTLELPCDEHGKPHPPIAALMRGLDEYDPGLPERHTSDDVIAFWLCCTMMRKAGMISDRRHLGIS